MISALIHSYSMSSSRLGVETDNGVSHGGAARGGIQTDFLIIGAGPAGSSLACFLASYGRHISCLNALKATR